MAVLPQDKTTIVRKEDSVKNRDNRLALNMLRDATALTADYAECV
ncbi:hypothetical protein [Pseudomonas sp. FP2300]|nr:hypothetical protein [Pseudomonas sp. FP2300]WLH65128.1 hypothetical protein PSH86_11345 [Pseudomonas sp. FP2300]